MKPSKSRVRIFGRPFALQTCSSGFALVVTLSLMILLTIIAVGLLSLSTISFRSSSQGEDMATARANARMALMLAIGDLQKHLGPDQRISTTGDQIPKNAADGSEPLAPERQRKWTAAYDSWPAASVARPAPAFRAWLVSGAPQDTASKTFNATAIGGSKVELVGVGSVGTVAADGRVEVPVIEHSLGLNGKVRLAWWVGDEGVKACAHSDLKPAANGISQDLIAMQAAGHFGLEIMKVGGVKPFDGIVHETDKTAKLISLKSAAFAAASPESALSLFHDLSTINYGLAVNVRAGGFRRDLSMALQATTPPGAVLYQVGDRKGINMNELWAYHNLWSQLKPGLADSYTTGGSPPASVPYLQAESSAAGFRNDKFSSFKQPVVIRFQTVVSFASVPVTTGGVTNYKLGVVVDPLVTLWNPYDVPISMKGSWNSTKYWPIPYDIVVTANGVEHRVSMRAILGNSGYPHYLTLRTGRDMVIKPGEVIVYSQNYNTPTTFSPKLSHITGMPGWNFGGGLFYEYKDNLVANPPLLVNGPGSTPFSYRVEPNNKAATSSKTWYLNGHGLYHPEDLTTVNKLPDPSPAGADGVPIGNFGVDWIWGHPYSQTNEKPDSLRILASDSRYKDFFDRIGTGRTLTLEEVSTSVGNKQAFMVFSFAAKTEVGSENPGRFLARYNPRAVELDFFDLQPNELRTLPFEVQVRRLTSWLDPLIDVSSNGSGYFGSGWTVGDGMKQVITHSIPRHPPVSLAAFQHSMANGFTPGGGKVAGTGILLPQISHAIGNSLAPSVIAPDKTEGNLGGPRPLADHSYLANQALWDDWFLSGISPQTAPGVFATPRDHRTVALDFMRGTKPLPVGRYKPNMLGRKPDSIMSQLFNGNAVKPGAEDLTASLISVEGMFNVNSTSVEAWKAVLSGLRDRDIIAQGATGGSETVDISGDVANASLLTPVAKKADAVSTASMKSEAQWAGMRVLKDDEIEGLANAIVREVRKRGPFLSLADFINRRVGTDKSLALSGAIQAALDDPLGTSSAPSINKAIQSGARASKGSEDGLAFPEAERGAAAYGIPGYVKQADVLTPIAPILSARSDTFVVRGYGEKLDATGKVTAKAWCEAVVRRGADFVDRADELTKSVTSLNTANRAFGRRFEIVSFRWLNPTEV